MTWSHFKAPPMIHLTDNELFQRFEYYTIQLESRLLGGEDFRSLGNEVPCMAVFSRAQKLEILETNDRHIELTGYCHEKIRENVGAYLSEVVEADSLESVRKFLPEFYARENPNRTTAFVQYARLYGDKDYSPLITFTKPPRQQNGMVVRLPVRLEEFGAMAAKMEQVVEMDLFKLKHFKQFQ